MSAPACPSRARASIATAAQRAVQQGTWRGTAARRPSRGQHVTCGTIDLKLCLPLPLPDLFGGEETATPAKQPKQKGASSSLSEPGPSQPTSSPSQSSTPASSRKRSSKTEKDKKGKREKKDKVSASVHPELCFPHHAPATGFHWPQHIVHNVFRLRLTRARGAPSSPARRCRPTWQRWTSVPTSVKS